MSEIRWRSFSLRTYLVHILALYSLCAQVHNSSFMIVSQDFNDVIWCWISHWTTLLPIIFSVKVSISEKNDFWAFFKYLKIAQHQKTKKILKILIIKTHNLVGRNQCTSSKLSFIDPPPPRGWNILENFMSINSSLLKVTIFRLRKFFLQKFKKSEMKSVLLFLL